MAYPQRMEWRPRILVLALILCAAGLAGAEPSTGDAAAKAAQAVREDAVALLAQARLFSADAGSQLTDAPRLPEQVSRLKDSVAALKKARGQEKQLDAVSLRLVGLQRLLDTHRPLDGKFLHENAQAFDETARQALALADGKTDAGALAMNARGLDLRDAPAALPGATERVGEALAKARQALGAPTGEPGPLSAPAAKASPDKTAVVSRYDKKHRAGYDEGVYTDQLYLKALGYLEGEADGKHGPKTDEAIRKFKRDLNAKGGAFADNGDITEAVRSNLRMQGINKGVDIAAHPLPPLKDPKAVGELHYRLNRALHSDLAAAPSFGKVRYGPATRRRIAEFQKKNGIPVSGKLDQTTWDKLVDQTSRDRAQPAQPIEGGISVRGARATVYYPGLGDPNVEGPAHDRFMAPLCTAEKYARGGCDAITVAIDQRLQVRRGTPVYSPELDEAYLKQCKAMGLPCDRPARFQISDTGACWAFNGDNHIDVATESTERRGFGRVLNREDVTLIFPQGLPRDASLRNNCSSRRRKGRRA